VTDTNIAQEQLSVDSPYCPDLAMPIQEVTELARTALLERRSPAERSLRFVTVRPHRTFSLLSLSSQQIDLQFMVAVLVRPQVERDCG
jgi:hypothetical protein